ncbi:hypothetical protein K470DRAFT_288829 [Piedraia hortae CBS 480.64]|uniref:Uncharacterized protein n=1 Tax=Piedraia hortae CBS 480.64 TaxID=1314780 RepID=A0A6A7BWL4_9PEZI|nr:hypothetical protein K470DRAFT_288829 [Piedraia hortae CBS 480.64]
MSRNRQDQDGFGFLALRPFRSEIELGQKVCPADLTLVQLLGFHECLLILVVGHGFAVCLGVPVQKLEPLESDFVVGLASLAHCQDARWVKAAVLVPVAQMDLASEDDEWWQSPARGGLRVVHSPLPSWASLGFSTRSDRVTTIMGSMIPI